MKRHPTRPTLLNVIRTGQSFYIIALTPDGETESYLYGFWENEDDRPYTAVGSLVNAAKGLDGFGNFDLYVRDREGRTYCVEFWTVEIDRFMKLLSTTRYVRGTATGASEAGESITLEYVNEAGEPDAYTFDRSLLVSRWSFWTYKSRFMHDEPKPRYLTLILNNGYVTDLLVSDELFEYFDELFDCSLGDSWMMVRDDESPKHEAAATYYALKQAA